MEKNNMHFIGKKPNATAHVYGSDNYSKLQATVDFFETKEGVLVSVVAMGLPKSDDVCHKPIFAFHIHSGESCTGKEGDPFADAMTHYNPDNCLHPYHRGDMPPLFGVNGYAVSIFLTDRFTVNEVIGKTVIIHSSPDDFATQPSGNSGEKIACGVIKRIR